MFTFHFTAAYRDGNNLTNEELAYMHMANGAAHGNAREAVRLYQERFPNRYLRGHEMFTAIHRRLREHGSFRAGRRDHAPHRLMMDVDEDNVMQYFRDRPRASTRAAARALGLPNHMSGWRVLHQNRFHPYRFQKV